MNKDSKIFGIYPVLEAIKSETVIDKVFIATGSSNDKLLEIERLLTEQNTTINMVPVEKLDKLTRGNHQGVVAIVSPISFHSLEDIVASSLEKEKPSLFLILDQISDVRNFGAIIRTAECTGVDAIIIQKKGGAPVSGAAGAIFNIPICKVDHIKDAIFYLQGSGIKTIAATEKTNVSVYDSDLTTSLALVMGSEGKGVSKSVLGLVDEKLALPLLGQTNSLNVSVASGAFLYEVTRQRSL